MPSLSRAASIVIFVYVHCGAFSTCNGVFSSYTLHGRGHESDILTSTISFSLLRNADRSISEAPALCVSMLHVIDSVVVLLVFGCMESTVGRYVICWVFHIGLIQQVSTLCLSNEVMWPIYMESRDSTCLPHKLSPESVHQIKNRDRDNQKYDFLCEKGNLPWERENILNFVCHTVISCDLTGLSVCCPSTSKPLPMKNPVEPEPLL